jgi:hypothetical protein
MTIAAQTVDHLVITARDLIAPKTSSETLQQHVACFPCLTNVFPSAEHILDLTGLNRHVVADGRPPIYGDKSRVPMVLLGELKVAPYVNKTAEKFPGQSGKQRSGSHIASYGPGIMFDVDSAPVSEIERTVKALELAYIVYTSHSSGEESRDDKTGRLKVKGRGRLVLFLDGTWSVDDHERVCRAIDRVVLDGVADAGAFSRGQGFYIAGLKQHGQTFYHAAQHGGLLSLNTVLAQAPRQRGKPPTVGRGAREAVAWTPDELILEEAREIGALGSVDHEPDRFRMFQSIRRTWPDRRDFAVDVGEGMLETSGDPKDRAYVEAKMDRDDGDGGHDSTFGAVRDWARKCAVAIVERAHGARAAGDAVPLNEAFAPRTLTPAERAALNRKNAALTGGIAPAIPAPAGLDTGPENVRHAVRCLARRHHPSVIDGLVARFPALSVHQAEIDELKGERAAHAEEISAGQEVETRALLGRLRLTVQSEDTNHSFAAWLKRLREERDAHPGLVRDGAWKVMWQLAGYGAPEAAVARIGCECGMGASEAERYAARIARQIEAHQTSVSPRR